MNRFADFGELGPQEVWAGVVVRAVHGERVTMALVELEPNAVVPEHSHEPEQLGVLLEGSMTFVVDGETRKIVPGGTWRILANVPHSVTSGEGGAVLLEVFAPTRDDWQAIAEQEPAAPRWPPPPAANA